MTGASRPGWSQTVRRSQGRPVCTTADVRHPPARCIKKGAFALVPKPPIEFHRLWDRQGLFCRSTTTEWLEGHPKFNVPLALLVKRSERAEPASRPDGSASWVGLAGLKTPIRTDSKTAAAHIS